MNDAAAIGNEFIRLAKEEDRTVTPMQVIKLAYIAHGWCLALNDVPLFNDQVQAWKFGPVLPELYHALKMYGNGPVEKPIWPAGELQDPGEGDRSLRALIRRVWDEYKECSAWQLSELTHREGTPWSQIWEPDAADDRRILPIGNPAIRDHYRRLIQQQAAA